MALDTVRCFELRLEEPCHGVINERLTWSNPSKEMKPMGLLNNEAQ